MPNIVRLNSAGAVGKDVLLAKLESILDDATIPRASWELLGPPQGRRFVVAFKGAIGNGAIVASKFLRYLRNDGDYRNFDINGTKLFFAEDKARCQVVMEQKARRLFNVLREQYPELDFRLIKNAGSISVKGRKLAKVVAESFDDVHVEWNAPAAAEESIDCQAVLEQWKKSPWDDETGVVWSRG